MCPALAGWALIEPHQRHYGVTDFYYWLAFATETNGLQREVTFKAGLMHTYGEVFRLTGSEVSGCDCATHFAPKADSNWISQSVTEKENELTPPKLLHAFSSARLLPCVIQALLLVRDMRDKRSYRAKPPRALRLALGMTYL